MFYAASIIGLALIIGLSVHGFFSYLNKRAELSAELKRKQLEYDEKALDTFK